MSDLASELPRGLRVAHAWLDQIRAATGAEPDSATVERVTADCYRARPCRDCGADLGRPHTPGCDVARCMHNGIQRIQCTGYIDKHGSRLCDCDDLERYDADGYTIHMCGLTPHGCGTQAWDGVWPGYEEAIEYGLYSYFDRGWHPCGPEHPEGTPDLNVLHTGLATWDGERGRFVIRPEQAAYLRGMVPR